MACISCTYGELTVLNTDLTPSHWEELLPLLQYFSNHGDLSDYNWRINELTTCTEPLPDLNKLSAELASGTKKLTVDAFCRISFLHAIENIDSVLNPCASDETVFQEKLAAFIEKLEDKKLKFLIKFKDWEYEGYPDIIHAGEIPISINTELYIDYTKPKDSTFLDPRKKESYENLCLEQDMVFVPELSTETWEHFINQSNEKYFKIIPESWKELNWALKLAKLIKKLSHSDEFLDILGPSYEDMESFVDALDCWADHDICNFLEDYFNRKDETNERQ